MIDDNHEAVQRALDSSLDQALKDPRRMAYRIVADLVERHLREYHGVQGELLVQLRRIEEAMRAAGGR